MSKAILVIDMPKGCYECPLAVETTHNYDACCITGSRIISYDHPDSCPLKPLPEKYEIDRSKCSDPFYDFEFEYGYNQCVEEILRGE